MCYVALFRMGIDVSFREVYPGYTFAMVYPL